MRAVDGRAPIVVRGRLVAGACISVSMLFVVLLYMPVVLFMVEKKLMKMFFHFLKCFHFWNCFHFLFSTFFSGVYFFRCLR